MDEYLKKLALVLFLIVFSFTLTSCDPINNFINNITGNNSIKIPDDETYAKVTFEYNFEGYGFFSLAVKKGEKIYEPIEPVVDGYSFTGWYFKENTSELFSFSNVIDKDTTITASWKLKEDTKEDEENIKATYNFNMPGLNLVTIKVTKGEKTIEPAAPARHGYVFSGWYLDDQAFDFTTNLNENITLIAKWEEAEDIKEDKEVSVTFNFKSNNNPITVKINYGDKVIEPKNPVKEDYTFVGWFKNETDLNAFNFQSNITADLALTAKWELGSTLPVDPDFKDVSIYFNYNAPNVDDIEIKITKGNKAIEPKIIENNGFVFLGWFLNNEETTPYDFSLPVEADLGLIGKWESAVYVPFYVDITYVYYNDDNEISTKSVQAEKGYPLLNPEQPTKQYYDFVGWYEEGSSSAFDFSKTIERNYVFIAKWNLKDVNVRVSFMKDNELYHTSFVKLGTPVESIDEPIKLNNYFIGWEDENGKFYDFSKEVFTPLILYAVYYPNLEAVNEISKNVMRGNVKIFKTLSDNSFPVNKVISQSTGSGVIVKNVGDKYYVLTNSHVISKVYKVEGGSFAEAANVALEIEDYLGRKYIGTTLIDGEGSESNVGHDLAIVEFTILQPEENSDLKVISISTNFDEDEILAIVGQPHGQKNTITFGKYLATEITSVAGLDKVTDYQTVKVSAPGAAGSSGSMVINQNYEIVGVVFAGGSGVQFVDSTYMITVPLSYILEIMDELEILTGDFAFYQELEYNGNFVWA